MTTQSPTRVADSTGEDSAPPFRYTAALANEIEARWQDRWEAEGTFEAPNPSGPLAPADGAPVPADKLYLLDMFPYPSGAGLHVGHPLGYIGTDVIGRFMRMTGRNVLHTIGYDAFGLPAEQYAVRTGTNPRTTTEANIARYRAQLRRLGFAHDQRRSVATTDPAFFRWTQWIFTQLFEAWYDADAGRARPIRELVAEFVDGTRATPDGRSWAELDHVEQHKVLAGHRLAYIDEAPVNWCPGLGTVLSNEEVTADGRSAIGNYPVFRRSLRQWMMRITAYADRLLDDLDRLDWPESVRSMQRNWIGRSSGATISFTVANASRETVPDNGSHEITVYTTRPDTLFGATYMVLAPEHPLVDAIAAAGWPAGTDERWTGGAATPGQAVEQYRQAASRKSDLDRQENKDKTGVFTGAFAVNPVDSSRLLPIFIADYVLMGYGTGAIMAVPAEDTRDFEFATAFGLPIVRTVQPPADHPDDQAYTGEGPTINSANDEIDLNGLDVVAAKAAMIDWLVAKGAGRAQTQYKLRDWLFSRQRYWGEPFPVVYDADGRVVPLPESMLPVPLPEVADFSPRTFAEDDAASEPESPLSRATDWVTVELDLGEGVKSYRRDTNTMPNWAGSCWYYLRYLDPHDSEAAVDPALEKYWMGPGGSRGRTGGVDLYVGGVEHAVLHLLYSRFWHKVLFDLGHVSSSEPFHKLFNQGYVQAFAYKDARGVYVQAAEVEGDEVAGFTWHGEPVTREYGKIGKSLKNMVSPDEMYDAYGADTFRVYEMSMGPLDVSRPWETRAVVGSQRFLQRLWRNVVDEETGEVTVTDAEPDLETKRLVAGTVAEVTDEMGNMRINTAIAKLIILNNHLTGLGAVPRAAIEPLVQMTAPVAPHIAEELWRRLGHPETITYQPWPVADPALLTKDAVTCVVQVKGKVRDRLEVSPDVTEAELEALALASEKVQRIIGDAVVRKVIVRAPNLVNIVV